MPTITTERLKLQGINKEVRGLPIETYKQLKNKNKQKMEQQPILMSCKTGI